MTMEERRTAQRRNVNERRISALDAEAVAEELAAPGFKAAADLWEQIVTGKIIVTPAQAYQAREAFQKCLALAHGKK